MWKFIWEQRKFAQSEELTIDEQSQLLKRSSRRETPQHTLDELNYIVGLLLISIQHVHQVLRLLLKLITFDGKETSTTIIIPSKLLTPFNPCSNNEEVANSKGIPSSWFKRIKGLDFDRIERCKISPPRCLRRRESHPSALVKSFLKTQQSGFIPDPSPAILNCRNSSG